MNYGNSSNFSNPTTKEKAYLNRTENMSNPEHKKKYFSKYIATCQKKYGTNNVSQHKPTAKKISNTKKEKFAILTLEEK